jgi:hypothetical protein
VTPFRAALNQPQIQTPDTSFKRHIQPSVSSPTVSHSPIISCPAQSSLTPCGPVLPHYINLYHLGHHSTSINLIGNYTPVETRIEELLKLGLEQDVCVILADAMALDKGLLDD